MYDNFLYILTKADVYDIAAKVKAAHDEDQGEEYSEKDWRVAVRKHLMQKFEDVIEDLMSDYSKVNVKILCDVADCENKVAVTSTPDTFHVDIFCPKHRKEEDAKFALRDAIIKVNQANDDLPF